MKCHKLCLSPGSLCLIVSQVVSLFSLRGDTDGHQWHSSEMKAFSLCISQPQGSMLKEMLTMAPCGTAMMFAEEEDELPMVTALERKQWRAVPVISAQYRHSLKSACSVVLKDALNRLKVKMCPSWLLQDGDEEYLYPLYLTALPRAATTDRTNA